MRPGSFSATTAPKVGLVLGLIADAPGVELIRVELDRRSYLSGSAATYWRITTGQRHEGGGVSVHASIGNDLDVALAHALDQVKGSTEHDRHQ